DNLAAIQAAPGAASEAAASALLAANATLVEYGINLYDPEGIPSGGWHSKRSSPHANKQETIFAEMQGEPGSSFSFTVLVGGTSVYGPVTVTDEILLTDLNIPIATGEGVSYMVTTSAGVYRINIESNGRLV